MNSITIDLVQILKREREYFINNSEHSFYSKYVKVIEKLSDLVQIHLVENTKAQKSRENFSEWFDKQKENYGLKKLDNIKYQRFPEPDYFTTNTEYFEYPASLSGTNLPTTHDDYNIILALQIRHAGLKEIYDLLELHRKKYHLDFDEFMYHLKRDYSFLFNPETQIVLLNWIKGAPKNHPKIFEKVEEWRNGTMISMDAFEKKDPNYDSTQMDELLDYMMSTPTNKKSRRRDLFVDSEPIAPIEIHEEKVSFNIEMRSVFITEERNWGRRTKYTKKQLKFLDELIMIVQDYLYKNDLVLQTKEYDPQYFWNNERNWKKETKERRQKKMFPELEYFILGDNIYYYYAKYSHTFEQIDSPNYQLFFAFRLRQMLVDDLEDFLTVKQKEFNGNFINFLKLILVKYKCLFSKPTKTITKEWIANNLKKSHALNKINHKFNEEVEVKNVETSNEVKSFLDTPFQTPPANYIKIEGKLSDQQLRKMLSIFCKESFGGLETLLSEESIKEVFKYGLAYPKKEPKEKPFELKLEPPKSKALVGYLFFLIYNANKDYFYKRDYKNHFAKFLKYQFSNFKIYKLQSIKDLMVSKPPKKITQKKLIPILVEYGFIEASKKTIS